MPDDQESRVRQRLSRLFDPSPTVTADPYPGSPAPTDHHGTGPDPAAHPHPRPVGPAAAIDPDWPTFDLLPPSRFERPVPDPFPEPVPAAGSEESPGSVPPELRGSSNAGPRRRSAPRRAAPPQVAVGNQFILSPAPERLASSPVVDGGDEEPERRASLLPGPGAFDPGRRGVRALAAVALVVVLGAALWAWRSRPHAETVRPVSTIAAADETSPAGSSGAANGQLVVAVAGKVRRPGLVRVPAGSRVADAVEAAGGALPGVDVALLNPARKVTDGELILVGVAAPPGPAGQPPAGGAAGPAAAGAAPGGPVNLNTATLAQLDALPGVGPVLAQRILTHREQHGGFRSVADLRQVEGIGDARYEQLKDLVTV